MGHICPPPWPGHGPAYSSPHPNGRGRASCRLDVGKNRPDAPIFAPCLIPRLDLPRVRLITRGGYDWTKRYPWIVQAALKNRHKQFYDVVRCVIPACRECHEATGVHYAARRNGYGVATWGARTTTTEIPFCWSAGVRVASASVRRRILARSPRPR